MAPDPADQAPGHRPQPLGVIAFEPGEPAFEEVEEVMDDLRIPDPELMDREPFGAGAAPVVPARLRVEDLPLPGEPGAMLRRQFGVARIRGVHGDDCNRPTPRHPAL